MDKISTPGIYDIPMDTYHGDCCVGPSVSSSGLRKIHFHCPAEYWAFSPYNKHAFPEPDGETLAFGRAAHCLLLGDEDFKARYAVKPKKIDGEAWNGNRKICREWIADIVSQCTWIDVPVFVKQMGTQLYKDLDLSDRHGGNMEEWPSHLQVRQFPHDYNSLIAHLQLN